MSDDSELNLLLEEAISDITTSPKKMIKIGKYNEGKYNDEEEDEIAYGKLVQWTSGDGKLFFPAGETNPELTPGVYEIGHCDRGIYFERIPVKTEGLVIFPQTNSEDVIVEIQKFWEKEKIFRDYNLTYKRGIILWGPAGSGKSSTIQLIIADVVERGGIVIKFTHPNLFLQGMRAFKEVQKNTPIVVLMEDMDSIIETYSETSVLNILDGVDQVDKTVFLACPSPDMLILMSDLTWIKAGDLRIGDSIIAFDEDGPNRKLRTAFVNSCPIVKRPCYRVTTEYGSVVVSEHHPFLIQLGNRPYEWRKVQDLRTGNRILYVGQPWSFDDTRDGGYLAGQFDGEGTLNFYKNEKTEGVSVRTVWTQASGNISRDVYKLLIERGYSIGKHTRQPIEVNVNGERYKEKDTLYIREGKWKNMRFLGEIRPRRLLEHPDLHLFWENRRLTGGRCKVVSVEFIGERDVIALDTTTKTFIGEGMLQHNTTNYPEVLGARILNRPSRFDKRFKIGHPNAESRKIYFEHLIGGDDKATNLNIDLKTWVTDTEGFSIAHLKELFVAVCILGDDYIKAVETLSSMKEKIASDDDFEKPEMGFGAKAKRHYE